MKLTVFQKLFFVFIILLTSIVVIVSCKKLDSDFKKMPAIDKAKKFLTVPAGAPSAITRIAETIRKQNDQTHFLDWFADKFGYAVWDKAPIMYQTSNPGGRATHEYPVDTVVLIPLVHG